MMTSGPAVAKRRWSLFSPAEPTSPYPLDLETAAADAARALADLRGRTVLLDGVLKGDYSLAIVNRHLARALIRAGVDLRLHSREPGHRRDPMLAAMPDVLERCLLEPPEPGIFDIHLRNTWPPVADDMVGRSLNAYVCFAWEETAFPREIVDHFNAHLDLVMVTAGFVAESLRSSGIRIPIQVVGNGTDHILDDARTALPAEIALGGRERILHVSSCFPRKGADLLVDAFTRTFTAQDPVELFIKTFKNPHNTIEEVVARTLEERPAAAPITVYKKSLDHAVLVELMRTSSMLVAPSRGEGFGLPFAEAMLLDVPVVTTGHGGQTDFCTPDTAWIVDHRMVASVAHVSVAGGVWAEPDIDSLGRQMRAVRDEPKLARAKLARGRALLGAHFKWSDVARRVAVAIAKVEAGRSRAASERLLSVDLVSTWSQACGVATYAEHLFATPSLGPTLRRVFAREINGDAVVDAVDHGAATPIAVTRPWGYDAAGIARLAADLQNAGGDVVWFQHHPGFFSDPDMETLSAPACLSGYAQKVITLHNVRETVMQGRGRWLARFDRIFVHTAKDAEMLAPLGLTAVEVVPHGILAPPAGSAVRRDGFTIGTFGFLYPHKNVPLLVEAVALARRVVPDLRLDITTCARSDPKSRMERARVEALIDALGLGDAVDADFRFLDDAAILARLRRADLLCFPYGESSESATGAVRIALAADRPILCSRSGVLEDILPYSLVLTRLDAASLAEAIVVAAASADVRGLRDGRRRGYVERNGYGAIADHYLRTLRTSARGEPDAA